MAANKRSKIQVERDRVEIARLYMRGEMQADIAGKLGLTQQQISYDLKVIHQRWLSSSLINYNEAKAQELAKIDHLERTYWESWERSLEQFTSKTLKLNRSAVRDKDEGALALKAAEQVAGSLLDEAIEDEAIQDEILLTIKTEDRVGDPRFLDGVQWCINKRCQILGLDAPTKITISWQKELLDLLRSGAITEQDILDELGRDVAQEFFESAGLDFAGVGPAKEEG